MNKFVICDADKCTGCSACKCSCPHAAISMEPDKNGFLHPRIDYEKCVGCKLCEKTCPIVNSGLLDKHNPIQCFSAIYKKKSSLSSSGGVCSLIVDRWAHNGRGCAFCTVFDNVTNAFVFKEINAHNYDSLKSLIPGSKYVQSFCNDSFVTIKNRLEDNCDVLFVGTPCQIAGLKRFLKIEHKNLTTVGIVCHGVPSQKMLFDHISPFSNNRISNVLFRSHDKYWLQIYDKNNSLVYKKCPIEDSFLEGFQLSTILRESCFHCLFTNADRIDDLTLGDFWGLSREHFKNESPSMVLVNTNKGKDLFDFIAPDLQYFEESISDAVNGNSQLREPAKSPKNRKKFLMYYNNGNFDSAIKKSRSLKSKIAHFKIFESYLKKKWHYN